MSGQANPTDDSTDLEISIALRETMTPVEAADRLLNPVHDVLIATAADETGDDARDGLAIADRLARHYIHHRSPDRAPVTPADCNPDEAAREIVGFAIRVAGQMDDDLDNDWAHRVEEELQQRLAEEGA